LEDVSLISKTKISFVFIFYFLCLTSVESKSIVGHYKISAGESVYLVQDEKECLRWHSKNEKVATVNGFGIVYGKNPGKTKIYAKTQEEEIDCYKVEVIEQKPIKFLFAEPNNCTRHSEIVLRAITHKNVESLIFLVEKENKSFEFPCHKHDLDGDTFVWSHKIGSLPEGTYVLRARVKVNNLFLESDCNYKIIVGAYSSGPSLHRRAVSDDCLRFILKCEGFVPSVYKDISGNLTIGCGKRVYPGYPFYDNLTELEGWALIKDYVNSAQCAKTINNFLVKNGIKFTQNHFDALVTFSYNVGTSWIINVSDLAQIMLDVKLGPKINAAVVVNETSIFASPLVDTVGVLELGDIVEILNKNEGADWAYIKTDSGIVGYCFKNHLKIGEYKLGKPGSLKNINKEAFAKEFLDYCHTGGKFCMGLLLRRARELNIFFYANYHLNDDWQDRSVITECIYPLPDQVKI
jgi:GH24 family phage-related lysozyme (muramidase)